MKHAPHHLAFPRSWFLQNVWVVSLVSGGFLCASPTQAKCGAPWEKIPRIAQELIRPLPLTLLASSALPPVVLSPTGADHQLRILVQSKWGGHYKAESVSIYAPYVLLAGTITTWVGLTLFDQCEGQKTTSAMIQGIALTLGVVATSKWVIGRGWPNAARDPTAEDRLDHPEDAHSYTPFRAGLAAFPSGHTAVMFAAAAALRTSAPELKAWRYVGYPFALGVAFGMWFGDHHWASDILSGALLGEALGGSAGRAWSTVDRDALSWMVVPLANGGAAIVSGSF